jgi:hypothetical protein
MDVGHLSQTWLTAAFYDEEITKRLRLDPARQALGAP